MSTNDVQVLVVSDHQETESLWVHCLEQRSLRAKAARLNADSRQIISVNGCELIILDIQDYGERALAICRYARATFAGPILLFTYEYDERFHLEAYRVGIDESITKPIGNTLAVAKVLSWLRRASESPVRRNASIPHSLYRPGMGRDAAVAGYDFRIDTVQRLLTTPEGRIAKLSKLECRLLSFLSDNAGEIVSPNLMLDQVWAGRSSMNLSRLKNLIYRLRKKIEPDPEQPRYLRTVPGYGYSFDAEINR
jgi:two-component system OmpR family response regulator